MVMLKGGVSDKPVNNCRQQEQEQQVLTNENIYRRMDGITLIQCNEKMKQIYQKKQGPFSTYIIIKSNKLNTK